MFSGCLRLHVTAHCARIGFEPRSKIRLNLDRARLADLGNLAIDADDAFLEPHVCGLEPEDFAGAEAGPDAGEQAQSEERHRSWNVRLHKLHQLFRLRCRERLRTAAFPPIPKHWNLGEWVLGDPFAMQRELQKP